VIVLLIILVVAAVGGMAAYVILQYTGLGSTSPSPGNATYLSGRGSRDSALSERIADASPGCLIAVLISVGVWVTLWLVLLVLGLRVLTA